MASSSDYWDGEITMSTDWGGDASTGNKPVSGRAIQKFIKDQFGCKGGYFYRTAETEVDNLFHIKMFANEEAFLEWRAAPEAMKHLVLADVSLPDQTSSTASYVTSLINGNGSVVVSTDGSIKLKFRFFSQLYSPISQSTTDSGEYGVLTLQTRLDAQSSWVTKAVIPNIPSLPTDTLDFTVIDISEYLANGTQQVRYIVKGDVSEQSTNYVQFTATKTKLSINFATQWELPILDKYMQLAYHINGAVAKTLNLKISGPGGYRTVSYDIGQGIYTEAPYTVKITDSVSDEISVMTAGIHTIDAWLSVNGTDIISEHVISNVLVISDPSDKTPYIILNNVAKDLTNWTDVLFFDYAIYNPTQDDLPVDFVLANYDRKEEYMHLQLANLTPGVQYSFKTMIEIEKDTDEFDAYMDILSNGQPLAERLGFKVDNRENFAPTAGADFILNPRLRSNDEDRPDQIINAVTNQPVPSKWTKFEFDRDAWNVDEAGNKCLRVLAGQELGIDYEAFVDFMGERNVQSLTIEVDLATHNVVKPETPILRMCSYMPSGLPLGFEIKPLEACFLTRSKTVVRDQDVMFQEDVRTHIAVNIVHNLGDRGMNYVRIFVNGIINREFDYEDTEQWIQFVDGIKTSQGIRIGSPDAEIDVYGIRVYRKMLSSMDVRKDYVATLPTSEEKIANRERNDILGNGNIIDYEKAKAKYNVMLWKYNAKHPTTRFATYGDNKKTYHYGDLYISMLGDNERSGVLNNLRVKGQGTSSMSYWKWNQRFEFNEGEKEAPTAITKFRNLNGDVFDGWQPCEGVPFAKRVDAKLNWASPMQSHKLGSTALYNDVWRKVVGNNAITGLGGGQDFTGTPDGYASCRVAVAQVPVMMFVQEDESKEPTFYGLYTIGASKGDKPTFGYDKKLFPDYTMMEGCDNFAPLANHRIPWNDEDVTLDGDGEKFLYNGAKNVEISMGSGNLVPKFKEMSNFIYLLTPNIHPFIGKLGAMQKDDSLNKDHFYWVTEGDGVNSQQYDIYRYDILTSKWVDCGITKLGVGSYERLNINEQCGYIASGNNWDAQNQKFIDARVQLFKKDAARYFNLPDLRYTMQFLKLIGASDNRAKNTYLYLMQESDTIMFFQDDLDTIFATDNVGRKNKPYYVEEYDKDPSGNSYWNASDNALYKLTELAYPQELRATMRAILDAMVALGGSVSGCFEKYYFHIQKYFPAVAYNEIARLLYEDAAVAMKEGKYSNNTVPLPQCLGDQLEAERAWLELRETYISSYCSFGEFASGNAIPGALEFRSVLTSAGEKPVYNFRLTPHIWMYPAAGTGDSAVFGVGQALPRRVKAGESVLIDGVAADGNTNVRILGINHYRKIGEFGDKPLGEAFALSGKRLTEFSATGENLEFKPTSILVTTPNLRKLNVNGVKSLSNGLMLKNMWRLLEVDARNTSMSGITLPESGALERALLPGTLTGLIIRNLPNLNYLFIENTALLTQLIVRNAPLINTLNLITKCMDSKAHLGEVNIDNVNWDTTGYVLNYLLSVHSCYLRGKINIDDPIPFTMKQQLVVKFGNVDNEKNDLYVTYVKRAINSISIGGGAYMSQPGKYQFTCIPDTANGNDFKSITWHLGESEEATVDPLTGEVTVKSVGTEATKPHADLTCTLVKTDGSVLTATITLYFYYREARVGDYVYYDGTYSDVYDPGKTVVGICFYINPYDKTDRRMVALKSVYRGPWGLDTAYLPNVTLADHPSYSPYKVAGLTNNKSLTNQGNRWNMNQDSAVRDELQGDPDGFIIFPTSYLAGEWEDVKMDFDFAEFHQGDIVPQGQYNSLMILRHRNLVLGDSSINFPVPSADERHSEWQNLKECLSQIRAQYGSTYAEYYYPVISYCFAYEPAVKRSERLINKFKAHNWYLASFAEASRLWWYNHKTKIYDQLEDKTYAIFYNASNLGLFDLLEDSWWGCSNMVRNTVPTTAYNPAFWTCEITPGRDIFYSITVCKF